MPRRGRRRGVRRRPSPSRGSAPWRTAVADRRPPQQRRQHVPRTSRDARGAAARRLRHERHRTDAPDRGRAPPPRGAPGRRAVRRFRPCQTGVPRRGAVCGHEGCGGDADRGAGGQSWARAGVRVSAIRPGAVFTEINQRAGLFDDATALERLQGLGAAHALGRHRHPRGDRGRARLPRLRRMDHGRRARRSTADSGWVSPTHEERATDAIMAGNRRCITVSARYADARKRPTA